MDKKDIISEMQKHKIKHIIWFYIYEVPRIIQGQKDKQHKIETTEISLKREMAMNEHLYNIIGQFNISLNCNEEPMKTNTDFQV